MPETAIAIKGVTKDFPLGLRGVKLRAVDDLSLTVADNQVFGLLGPNGSGKSTTIKVILGLLAPTLGSCHIYGVPAGQARSRADVGFLPEAPYFYRYLTGRELVRYFAKLSGLPRDEIDDRADEVIALTGMTAAAGRRVGNYSKGMLQRIGLAQALVHDPRLVILDEPTAGVDPIGSAAIADIIRELKRRGKTVLLCSHLLAQVEGVCDHIAILDKGRRILEGPVDDLLSHDKRQAFIVENGDASLRAELETFLAERGARLADVDTPRLRLDELFLQHVKQGD